MCCMTRFAACVYMRLPVCLFVCVCVFASEWSALEMWMWVVGWLVATHKHHVPCSDCWWVWLPGLTRIVYTVCTVRDLMYDDQMYNELPAKIHHEFVFMHGCMVLANPVEEGSRERLGEGRMRIGILRQEIKCIEVERI